MNPNDPNTLHDQMRDRLNEMWAKMDDARRKADLEWHRKLYGALSAKCVVKPTDDELRDIFSALLWTDGLQDDLGKFLRKFPHLDPRTHEPT